MKKCIAAAFIVGFVVTMLFACYAHDTKSEISGSVVRLHVLANSDSQEDQELKLKVRDAVLRESKEIIADADSQEEVLGVLSGSTETLRLAAEREVQKNGYDYPVRVTVESTQFPTKYYENVALPAGEYKAVRVMIGQARGQNWWCVLYPPLCFSGADGELSDDDLKTLKSSLTEDEYDIITKSDKIEFKFKFKLLELFGR